jgi:hypothetical protein
VDVLLTGRDGEAIGEVGFSADGKVARLVQGYPRQQL